MNFSRFFRVFLKNPLRDALGLTPAEKNPKKAQLPVAIRAEIWYNKAIEAVKEYYIPMSEFNTFEFVVDERPEGKRKAMKFWGRFGLLAIIAAWVIISLCTIFYLAILPMALLGVVLYFWKIFNCELEYSMTSGMMTFSRIYGGIRRKKVLDVVIKDFRTCAPRTPETDAKLKAQGVEKIYMFASHSTADDQYCATFDQDGQLCAVYFEATEKALKILRYYNPTTVVTKVSR